MAELDRKSSSDGEASSASSGGTVGKSTLVQRRYGAVQRKAGGDGAAEGSPSGGGGGAPMPEAVESKMSQSFGIDLSGVRVHEGPEAGAMGAQAYAQGTDLHFAPGKYEPTTPAGQELLGHELAHVVQQSQGRVGATTQAKGKAVNDDPALEHEADVAGARAARGEPASLGALGGGGAGPAQMKREPISVAGKNVITLAETFFKATDKKVEAGTALKDAAKLLDLTKEKNQEFVAVATKFAADAHTSDESGTKSAFQALQGEITAEALNEVEAKKLESTEGGHALDRHGPGVSDDLLERRLFTGIAPDGALVPAPGASTRFNSHTDYLETRQKAAKDLGTEIANAQKHVLTWTTTEYPQLATTHSTAQINTTAKTKDVSDKEKLKNEGFAKGSTVPGPDKKQRLTDFQQAGKAKDTAVAEEATALDEKDNPGKSLKKVLAGKTKVKFTIGDKAAPTKLESGVALADSYGITIDNGHAIGTGAESNETDAIKLKEIIAKVYVPGTAPPTPPPPVPKSKGDITNELTTLGVTTNIADLADLLADQANVDAVSKKADKGAKVYKGSHSSGALTKSYTNFEGSGDPLFDDKDAALAIDTAGWKAIQHFPAPAANAVGLD